MSNDIYKIINNFNKLTEQKPEPTQQKVADKPKTQLQESIEQVSEKYMGFKKTVAAIKKGGSAENPEAVAAAIGRKKYGKEKFQKAAAAGKKLGEGQGVAEDQQPGRFSGKWQVLVNGEKVLSFRGQIDQETANRIGVVKATDAGRYNPGSGDKIKIVPVMSDESKGVAEDRQPGRFSGMWQVLVNRKKVLSFRGQFDQETADRIGVVKAADRGLYNPGSGDKIKIVPVMSDESKGVAEGQQDESALQAYLGKKKYGEQGMKALQKAGRDGASKEKMAKIRAQHDKMDEAQQVNEKAVSRAQQKFMGMVHSAQKGGKAASPEVAKVAKGMSKKAAKDFASTKHKGLPQHVNETIIRALEKGYTKEQIVQALLKESDKEYWKDLMKDVPDKGEVSKTVHKGHYGTEYQGDSDDEDDGQKKIAKPQGEKRGRGRPKGVKNRVVRAGEKKAASTGEKRGRGRPAGSKNKMKEAWEVEHNQMIAEAYTKIVEKELGQTYRADRMPNIPAPVPTDPTWIKDPKTGEWKPDVPKQTPAPKPTAPKGTEKRSDVEGDMAVAEMMRLAGMEGKLHGKQHRLDVDKDGDIEADDLSDLRAGKKVQEQGQEISNYSASPDDDIDYSQFQQSITRASPEYTKKWIDDREPEIYLGAKGSGWSDYPAQTNVYTPPGKTDRTKTMQKPNQYRFPMKEFDMEEGNEFSGALDAARDAGKKEFEVDGRTYPVKETEYNVRNEPIEIRSRMQAKHMVPGRAEPNSDVRLTRTNAQNKADDDIIRLLEKRLGHSSSENDVEKDKLDECGEMGPMANGMGQEQEGKMNVSTNMSSDGNKSVTVTADGEAAVELMQLLALAGMKQSQQAEVYMETAFKPAADTSNAARDAEEQRKRTQAKLKDAEKAGQQGPKAKKDELKGVKEEKDSRYEANTTPEEEVIPLEVQLKGGDGEVAGKEKQMNPNGSARFSDNPLAVKESMTAKLMREYEGIKVKK